jgi:azurin
MMRILTLVAALAVAATMFAVVAYGSSTRATATNVKVGAKEFTFTVTLKKGKKYKYICTVPGHAAAGMRGTFTAT